MSTKNELVTTPLPGDFNVTIPLEVIQFRDQLLDESGFIDADFLKTPAGMQEAIALVGKIKGFNASVEKTRKLVSRPILDAASLINDTAKSAVKKTEPEVARIERLISDKVAEDRRIAEAERQRVAREVAEAERKRLADEAAEQAKIAEANRLAKEAADAPARAAAAKEAARLEDARVEREMQEEFEREERERQLALAPPVQSQTAGASVRKLYVFEVTDIKALATFENGAYVTIEPKTRDLNARINLVNPGVDIFQIPGIKVTEPTKVSVRATRNPSIES